MSSWGVGVNLRCTPCHKWFRCPGCGVTYPESRWTPAEAQRYGRSGRTTACDSCYAPPPEMGCWEEEGG